MKQESDQSQKSPLAFAIQQKEAQTVFDQIHIKEKQESAEHTRIEFLERNIKRHLQEIKVIRNRQQHLIKDIQSLHKQLEGKDRLIEQLEVELTKQSDIAISFRKRTQQLQLKIKEKSQSQIDLIKYRNASARLERELATSKELVEHLRRQATKFSETILQSQQDMRRLTDKSQALVQRMVALENQNNQLKCQLESMMLDVKLDQKHRQIEKLTSYDSKLRISTENLRVNDDEHLIAMLKIKIQRLERDLRKSEQQKQNLRSALLFSNQEDKEINPYFEQLGQMKGTLNPINRNLMSYY